MVFYVACGVAQVRPGGRRKAYRRIGVTPVNGPLAEMGRFRLGGISSRLVRCNLGRDRQSGENDDEAKKQRWKHVKIGTFLAPFIELNVLSAWAWKDMK